MESSPTSAPTAQQVESQLCSALARFEHEPTCYALRSSVAAVLQGMLSHCQDGEAGAARAAAHYDDKVAFKEGEAMYLLTMQRYACTRVLEGTSYKVQARTTAATGATGASENAAAAEGAKAEAAAASAGGDAAAPPAVAAAASAFAGMYVHDTMTALSAALHAAEAYAQWRNAAVAAAGGLASRLDRLVALLELKPKEAALLRHVLFSQASQEEVYTSLSGDGRLTRGLQPSPPLLVGMTTQELLAFMSSERRHIREGLLPDCSKALLTGGDPLNPWGHLGGPRGSSLSLGVEIVKALIGESLSQEELLKIDKTAVMEVLAAEPEFAREGHPFQADAAAGAGAAAAGRAAGDGGGGAARGEEDPLALVGTALGAGSGPADLYELIKAEVRRDTSAIRGPRGLGALFSDLAATATAPTAGAAAKRARTAAAAAAAAGEGGDAAAAEGADGDDAGDGADGDEVMADGDGAAAGSAAAAAAGGAASPAAPGSGAVGKRKAGELRPYTSDLEYLESCFKLLMTELLCGKHRRVLAHSEEGNEAHGLAVPLDDYDDYYLSGHRGNTRARASQQVRELEGRERLERSRIEARLRLTAAQRQADGQPPWRPRLERLAEARSLAAFEKKVLLLLVGCRVSPSVARTLQSCVSNGYVGGHGGLSTVGNLLLAFYPDDLGEQINARRYFYKSGRLIQDGILTLNGTDFSKDIMEQGVDLDRRMLDFLVGLDTEFSDMVDGSHLYFPSYVRLEDVILPAEQKQLIVETVENFSRFKKARTTLGMDSGPGGGLVLLFHGASGVGKTMMANAVAHHVGKKVLLINFPSLGHNEAGEVVRFIFREAKIHDALLFFDECESIFEDRDRGSHTVNMLLTEVERYDGIAIMATNRPHDIDEAMHRRITMAFEFRRPDHLQRLEIWKKQLPPACKLETDVNLPALALKYELSGGYIKNAVQAALSKATSRSKEGEPVALNQADLLAGAALQLRGALRLKDQDRQRVPRRGLEDVLLQPSLKEQLEKIVQHEKARAVLVGQWGFGAGGDLSGTTCLFYGPPGTGKTLAAEAVGYETGRPLKVVNCAGLVSKWVGDTPKNIDALFADARALDAVLVFDEAEGLFGTRPTDMASASDRYAAMDVGVLLYHLETHPGIVVLITNQPAAIDKAFHRRIRFMLNFAMPDAALRAKLWRAAVPQQTPLAGDVDWSALGDRHELSGGAIRNAVIRAATRAALRMTAGADAASGGAVSMADLAAEAAEEANRGEGAIAQQVRAMYM
ncbi:hypothetical protein PLESTB_000046300 [Pleodorina starrii]|uniref:AAA+ ATPase domain-containing protein n=1 Tax=Pleodorina starrii TaxID=330485 RepID=A0A9W6EWN6_9CHLO|nr:hypothetical protein PLESTB_000046300 [Pleodorina starrii]